MLDPDFGWHYQMGKYILSYGIPATDPFSYTMSTYPYVDHAWLTDVIFATFYDIFGQFGIALVLSSIFVLTLIFSIPKTRVYPYVVLFAAILLLPLVTMRPTFISWTFFALVLYVVRSEQKWKNYALLLPLLFLLWANIHAGFITGIFILFCRLLERIYIRKSIRLECGILFFSILATLVNPYGIKLWETIISIIFLRSHYNIVEWKSVVLTFDTFFYSYIVIACVFIFLYHKSFSMSDKAAFFFFLVASAVSTRHFPYLVITGLSIISSALEYVQQAVKRIHTEYKLQVISGALISIILISFIARFIAEIVSADTLSEVKYYPRHAVEYLKKNPSKGEIFSDFNWGGYLIWKLPNKKVFIDNRMVEWVQEEKNNKREFSAVEEYNRFINGSISLQELEKKYMITTFLLPQIASSASTNFLQLLKKNKYRKVYEDAVSVIYKKTI